MLDTIALTLDRHQFEVLDPDRFSPSAKGLLLPPYYPLGGRGNFACVRNPTKRDIQGDRYLPRLTLSRRKVEGGFSLTLRVEFSAPKLVFGNNFDELRSRDFEQVLSTLQLALGDMDVRVAADTLRAARVSAVHYGKNIVFTNYTTCSMVIRELALIDLGRRLDLSRTDCRDEGHAICYHANSYEVTFYDKLKDLEQSRISEKRAIERDYGAQMQLFGDRGSCPKELQVLRMEVRLGNRTRIVNLLKRIEPGTEPTFKALFNVSIAKAVLMQFWTQLRAQLPMIEGARDGRPEDLLVSLAAAASGRARPGTLLQQLGCLMLVGSVGFRGADAILSRHCSARSWQRYKRQIKALPQAELPGFSALRQVDVALTSFQPLRMASFNAPSTGGSSIGKSG
jgi:hypothetical protein